MKCSLDLLPYIFYIWVPMCEWPDEREGFGRHLFNEQPISGNVPLLKIIKDYLCLTISSFSSSFSSSSSLFFFSCMRYIKLLYVLLLKRKLKKQKLTTIYHSNSFLDYFQIWPNLWEEAKMLMTDERLKLILTEMKNYRYRGKVLHWDSKINDMNGANRWSLAW